MKKSISFSYTSIGIILARYILSIGPYRILCGGALLLRLIPLGTTRIRGIASGTRYLGLMMQIPILNSVACRHRSTQCVLIQLQQANWQ